MITETSSLPFALYYLIDLGFINKTNKDDKSIIDYTKNISHIYYMYIV